MSKFNNTQKFIWNEEIQKREELIIDSVVRTASEENRRIDDSMLFHWASRACFADMCFEHDVDITTVTEGQYLKWFRDVNDSMSDLFCEISNQAFINNTDLSDESETK